MSKTPAYNALSGKQQKFVDHYIINGNGVKAALVADYSKKNAHVSASSLLKNPKIMAAILEFKVKQQKRTDINADWVLSKLADMFDANYKDIIDEDNTFKPIHDWPDVWTKMLSGTDIKELYENKENIGQVIKAKFIDRLKALELIGKHIDVSAFEDRLKVKGDITITTVDYKDAAK